MTSPAALVATGLVRRHGAREVVSDVGVELSRGESLALLGPSGCGKTTLLQMLGLLDRPDAGSVTLDGIDAWSASVRERDELRLGTIGFVLQTGNLLGHLDSRDNVALPAWRLSGSRRVALSKADALLERFGLRDRARARATELSSGEAQRVAVARALVNSPRVVLADEPTGNLHSEATEAFLDVIAEVARDGAAVLVVTHDARVAARLGRTIRMRDGKIVRA